MFIAVFLRLLASMAIEGAYNFSCLLVSLLPWKKHSMRLKMKTIMCKVRQSSFSIFFVCLSLVAAGLVSGCSNCNNHREPLGASLAETWDLLRETRDPIEELSWDAQHLFGPEWDAMAETLQFLQENRSPWGELVGDLKSFFTPEWDEFSDTLCRLAR